MNPKQIDKFFKVFSQNIKGLCAEKIKVILTGAAAGNLMGGVRPSIDIDFCLEYNNKYAQDIESAIKQASKVTGIAVNFSEDIDRWSQITYLDYKRHYKPYKRFGNIEVAVLAPAYWAIGKIARYIDTDVDDLIKVLKENFVSPNALAKLLGKALLESPRSSASFAFKTHAEHFFKAYGASIWGKTFNLEDSLDAFYKASHIAPKNRNG